MKKSKNYFLSPGLYNFAPPVTIQTRSTYRILKFNKRKIFRWFNIIGLTYIAIGGILYFVQDEFLFHPTALEKEYKYSFTVPFKEVNIPVNETTNLNLVQFMPADTVRRGVVLYFHGNKENINRYARFANHFTKHGYEVWMMDYPGFGKTTGIRKEERLYSDAALLYKLALVKYKPEQMIIYGKSIGTAVAAQLASVRPSRRLILETPYYDIAAVARQYFFLYPVRNLMQYKLPANQFIPRIAAPISIFQGTSDWVVHYSTAHKLRPLLKPGDEFITIEGGNHHNLNTYLLMQGKLDSLLTK
jgi:uncharacterized protein